MRLGDGGRVPAAVAVVAVLLAVVDSARAKPNFLPEGQRPEERVVEVSQTPNPLEEQECPSSILYKWLEEQEPWHIMGNHLQEEEGLEVQSEDDPFPGVQLQNLGDDDLVAQHQEEQEEGEEVEGAGASEDDVITSPVSLEILGGSEDDLLDPGNDYEVFVLSDTENTARILLVLDTYLEMSTCGVGGFIKVEDNEDLGSNYALPADALRIGPSADYDQDPNYVPPEGGMNSTITVGECFWWAEGVLVGGDEVSVEYTPPECGCVMLSVYAAFDIENRTLISGPNPEMGPQSKLLCVDRTVPVDQASEHLVQLQDALPVPQNATDVDTQSNELTDDYNGDDEGEVTPQPVESKAKRRKKWRQRIRKNRRKRGRCTKRNWWKCRKNKVARLYRSRGGLQEEKENENGESEDESENTTKAHRKNHGKFWKKKRQHKRKKGWRKIHRQHKRARKANPNKCTRWRRRRGLCNVTEVPEVQDGDMDTSNETESSQEPGADFRSQIYEEDENEDLFNLLVGPEGDYETTLLQGKHEYQEEQEEQEEQGEQQEPLEPEEGGKREGRKLNSKPLMNRRKMRRMLPPGKKFCCKQGIAMKKTTAPATATTTSPIEDLLLMTPAHEDQQEVQEAQKVQDDDEEEVCLGAPQEVTTWAHYKLQIEPSECETVYKTCCTNFDVEWWLGARQRKLERKERRKKNFQQKRGKKGRRQQKKMERKAKMEAKKSRWEAKKAKWNTKGKGQVEE